MQSLRLIVTALLLGCASTPPAAPPATKNISSAAPTVPDTVNNLGITRAEKYPDPRLGAMYRYGQGSFRPDVYVYGKSGWGDPTTQARDFMPTLDFYQQRGEYDSYQVLLTQSINLEVGGRVLTGHEIIMKYYRKTDVRDSYFAVVSLPTDEYVKFRITQPQRDEAISASRDFVKAWLSRYLSQVPK